MAIKKSEYAMISNLFRNVFNPFMVYMLAKYINASFEIFFWIWTIVNWIFSAIFLAIIVYYLKSRLEKTSAVINPQP